MRHPTFSAFFIAKMNNHKTITVYYDPAKRNWHEAAENELARLALKSSETNVICLPSTKLGPEPVQTYLFTT